MGARLDFASNNTASRRFGFGSDRRIENAWDRLAHWNVSGLSSDRTVSAVAEVVGQGRIRISAQAFVEERRNATVHVVLRCAVDPSDVWITGDIKLDLNGGYLGIWSGAMQDNGAMHHLTDAELVVGPVRRS